MYVTEIKSKKGMRYRFTETYLDLVSGKTKQANVTLDSNSTRARKEATTLLTKKIELKQSFQQPNEKPKTFEELVELFRESQEEKCKPSSYRRDRHICNTLAKILKPDTLLTALNAPYVEHAMKATGDKNSTLNNRMERLKCMMRWAYRKGHVDDIAWINRLDRFSDVSHRAKIQDKFLEAEEAKSLLAAMEFEHWNLLTKFMLLTGMRIGEVIALERKDVDVDNRTIHVNKTYDHVNYILSDSTKTDHSTRTIYIQDDLLLVCNEVNRLMKKKRFHYKSESQLFFHDELGDYVGYAGFNKYLRSVSKKVLGKEITTHVLRHTHCSLMAEQGQSLDYISQRLGHSDSRITKRVYLHTTDRSKQKQNEVLREVRLFG